MSKGIFYSTRPLSGREGKSIMHHLPVIQSSSGYVSMLSDGKTDANANYVSDYSSLSIDNTLFFITEFYLEHGIHMGSWAEFYDKLDVSPLADYEDLYLMGGMDLWRSGLTRNGKRAGIFPNDRGQINFVSTGLRCANILGLLKAHNTFGSRMHELAFDPNEFSMDQFHDDYKPTGEYHIYHGYDIPRYNIKRLDSSQYEFSKKFTLFPADKLYDFTFGYTVLSGSERAKYVDFVNELYGKFDKANLFVKSDCDIPDTSVDRDVYLSKIEESRFTLMLPSYDESCFSIYRFIESLDKDCLPLIHESCKLDEVEASYGVDLSPLVVTEPFAESKRLELLDYYKSKFTTFEKGFRK